MRARNRRDEAADAARLRILEAAADVIVEHGVGQLTMAKVGHAAEVSTGLVHYHFSTKEQLFAAVIGHTSAVSRSLTDRVLTDSTPDPAHRLMTLLDRCLPSDEQLTRDWWLWQELDLLCLRNPDLAEVSAEVYGHLYEQVERLLLDGHGVGTFDLDRFHTRDVAETAVALCDGLGERVLSPDALDLDGARRLVAYTVGRLVGHDGPLPLRAP